MHAHIWCHEEYKPQIIDPTTKQLDHTVFFCPLCLNTVTGWTLATAPRSLFWCTVTRYRSCSSPVWRSSCSRRVWGLQWSTQSSFWTDLWDQLYWNALFISITNCQWWWWTYVGLKWIQHLIVAPYLWERFLEKPKKVTCSFCFYSWFGCSFVNSSPSHWSITP